MRRTSSTSLFHRVKFHHLIIQLNSHFGVIVLEQTCATRGPRAALWPAALFGAARLVLFMILKWYFK